MTTKKESRGFFNFGFSTIILSFVMICVITFSALSLVTANSDYKLSKKVAANTKAYYEAEEAAYNKLATVDKILYTCYNSSSTETDYFSAVEALITEYGILEKLSGKYLLSYAEPISEGHRLSVTISINYPQTPADTFHEILEWKSVYEQEVPEDENLNLIH